MPQPTLHSAFLSVVPPEPVLVFSTPSDATHFQSRCRQGRILVHQNPTWVYLPMPKGLLRVRTARNGDVAFEFENRQQAKEFNASIGELGTIYAATKMKPNFDANVYLGKQNL